MKVWEARVLDVCRRRRRLLCGGVQSEEGRGERVVGRTVTLSFPVVCDERRGRFSEPSIEGRDQVRDGPAALQSRQRVAQHRAPHLIVDHKGVIAFSSRLSGYGCNKSTARRLSPSPSWRACFPRTLAMAPDHIPTVTAYEDELDAVMLE